MDHTIDRTNYYRPAGHDRLPSGVSSCTEHYGMGLSWHVYNSQTVLLPMEFAFLREQQHGVATLPPEILYFSSWVLCVLLSSFAFL